MNSAAACSPVPQGPGCPLGFVMQTPCLLSVGAWATDAVASCGCRPPSSVSLQTRELATALGLWAAQVNCQASLHRSGRGPQEQAGSSQGAQSVQEELLWAPTPIQSLPGRPSVSVITSLLLPWGVAHCSTSKQRRLILSALMERFVFFVVVGFFH